MSKRATGQNTPTGGPSGSGISLTHEQFLLDSEVTLSLHVGGGFGFGPEAVADTAGSECYAGKAAGWDQKDKLRFETVTLPYKFTGEMDREGCRSLAHSRQDLGYIRWCYAIS